MSAKIIDTRRYKTITKSQLEKKKKNNESILKSEKKKRQKNNIVSSLDTNSNSFISNLRIRKHREKKKEQELLLYARPQKKTVIKEPKTRIYVPKSFIITCCVIFAIILIYTSVKLTGIDKKMTATVFNNTDPKQEEVVLEPNYKLNIGLNSLDTTDLDKTHNLILNDLNKTLSYSLIKSQNNYDIVYQVSKNIDKISDTSYKVILNTEYKLTKEDIIYSVNKIKLAGESNMYYPRVSNISSIEDGDEKNSIIINIYNPNPYFIYTLDFPIEDDEGKISYGYSKEAQDNSVVFNRINKEVNSNLSSINVYNYGSIKDTVDAYTSGKIDVFFASSNNDMQLIGKNDYNVKKYRDGETLFILGNKNSKIYSIPEIRTALMYSLDREEIVKSSDNNFIELIDLPFIYSSIKYKYDIVGAKNIMYANGWRQNSYGIFENTTGSATLRLLVNSQDENKLNVANNIKNMAYNTGINIEIQALTQEEIDTKIQAGDYDIVLATIYLDEIPDITFLKDYLNINEATNQAFLQVEQSSVEDLDKNIQNLEFVLSNEVACIGIYARNINLVYQKYIYGFDNINYMSIFNNILNIGKKIE